MNNWIEECSQWSGSSPQQCTRNLYSTLSQNLKKYQRFQKATQPKQQSFRIKPVITRKKLTKQLEIEDCQTEPIQNKQNDMNYPNVPFSLPKTSRGIRCNQLHRYPKTSNNNRSNTEDLRSLQPRQMKFERKDKKKGKNRWVDIFIENKVGRGRGQLSLRQLDFINKQQKEEKIELFMKMIKK